MLLENALLLVDGKFFCFILEGDPHLATFEILAPHPETEPSPLQWKHRARLPGKSLPCYFKKTK